MAGWKSAPVSVIVRATAPWPATFGDSETYDGAGVTVRHAAQTARWPSVLVTSTSRGPGTAFDAMASCPVTVRLSAATVRLPVEGYATAGSGAPARRNVTLTPWNRLVPVTVNA